jgi:hypothetical protein
MVGVDLDGHTHAGKAPIEVQYLEPGGLKQRMSRLERPHLSLAQLFRERQL